MKHTESTEHNVEYLKVLSVGIDIGTSTSHLIFSRLTLKSELSFFNLTNRFVLVNREIIYEGNIIFTPLIEQKTIDIEKVVAFCKREYELAEITPDLVDTGAVIVTGETAKKENAAEIVNRLASESGKFVSASAGPNFESTLGIMGSGILEKSKNDQKTYMNVDIEGGTSNIAIASEGDILSTSCINVGGRLLRIDNEFKIWRIDEPTEWVLEELELDYKIGDIISKEEVIRITQEYAKALVEVMNGPATSNLAKKLMMTNDIDIQKEIDGYSFSGGIAEMIYSANQFSEKYPNHNPYNDFGLFLALEIQKIIERQNLPIIESINKIRATVIGAGSFSLSVSGSTCYYDESIKLPIENIPVIPIKIETGDLINEKRIPLFKEKIELALQNYNIIEGKDLFALYFNDTLIRSQLTALTNLAKTIEIALPQSVANKNLILLILAGDGAKMLGLTIKRETSIKSNLFCLDELNLQAGDWIDIGAPLETNNRQAFPVTIKSLIFNNSKLF